MAFGKRAGVALVVLMFSACQSLGLVKRYEYDERVELSLDGSAVVDISASIPALVALRGATLSVDPEARFDRQAFRRLYAGPGIAVREVSAFRRHGRRFVHVRLDVSDIAQLPRLIAALVVALPARSAGSANSVSCRRLVQLRTSMWGTSAGPATS